MRESDSHQGPLVNNRAVTMRPVTLEDEPLLHAIYASTRADELALTGWPPDQQAAFVAQQFAAQQAHYRTAYPDADRQIIEVDGRPAGRLYVARRPAEIYIMEIALLPPYRGQGIGTRLLLEVLREGARDGRPVGIHVEMFNPAQRLYERLGFVPRADLGVYRLLEWVPDTASKHTERV